MKRLIGLFFLLALAAGCANTQPQTTGAREIPVAVNEKDIFTTNMIGGVAWAVPEGMDLEKYPIIERPAKGRKLTAAEAQRMGLHKGTAPSGTVLWNENPRAKSFELDTLDKGREVWLNDAGEIVYIVDCANRAMEPKKQQTCPAGVTCPGPHLAAGPGGNSGTGGNTAGGGNDSSGVASARQGSGFLNGFWNVMKDLFWLLLTLLLIVLMLALAFLLLRELVRWLQASGSGPRHYGAPVPFAAAPTRVARPRHMGPRPMAAAPVAAPPPVVEPEATFHRYGPYDDVQINNAGAQGFQVTAYEGNQERSLGVFQWADIEPTDGGREYVIVMI